MSPTTGLLDREGGRVLLVDPQPVFRIGVVAGLAEIGVRLSGVAESVERGAQLVRAMAPELVVADIFLLYGGLAWLQRLAEDGISVLVLADREESVYADDCIRLGACGFVAKSAPVGELADAIALTLGGGVYLGETASARVVRRAQAGITGDQDTFDCLSPREAEVFQLLGWALLPDEIAARMGISVKTVASYEAKLRMKLGAVDGRDLRHLAIAHQRVKAAGG